MRRRTAALAALAAALAAAPLPAAADEPIPAHPDELVFGELRFEVPDGARFRHQLAAGVPVYVAPDPTLPLVEVAVAVRAGDYLNPQDKAGLAGLAAAMLRRGGAGDLSAAELDERIDFLGAEIDTRAGGTRAGASLSCTTWVLDEALDLLFDVLRRPRFDPARLAAAKDHLRESMAGRNDDPLAVLEREWRWLLWGRRHFATRQLTAADLEAITPADLAAFHRRFWHPGNMVLAVSGDVEPEGLLAALERRFAGWAAGEPAPWPPPAPRHDPRPGLYHLERDLPQGKVILGHLGAVRRGWDDPEFFALLVMNEVLGGRGAVSRVLARLRSVEGLVYRASSDFGVGDWWPGAFQIFFEARNDGVARAAELALAEVERLRREPPSELELSLARRALVDPLPSAFDSAEEVGGYFAEDEYLGRPHAFWQTYRQRVEAVTAHDVQEVAHRHLDPERVLILVLGPWAEIAPGDPSRRPTPESPFARDPVRLPRRDPLTLEP